MCVPKCLPRLWFIVIVASISLIGGPGYAQNAVPMLINYEGELRLPATGDPVPDGTYSMQFKIYDVETGGTHLWEEYHSAAHGNPVQVRRGVFSVLLGSGMGDALSASVFSGSDRWLEVTIETETMSPRQRITSTAYSLVSQDSHLLDGNAPSDFAEAVHSHSGTDIVSGMVPEGRIDGTLARDTEVDSKITSHAGIPDAHHVKTTSFTELTDTALDAQIPPMIARDSEVSNEITAHEGVVDAHHARYADPEAVAAMGAKADANPLNHDKTTSFSELTGALSEGQIPPTIAQDSEIMPTVLANDGPGSTLNADLLDGVEATGFAAVGHTHEGDFWRLGGNSGTSPGLDFLGTTDKQAVELRVNGDRGLRVEPASTPNLIGGYAANAAVEGVVGAAIGGGGEATFANRVTDDFGTVGGGRGNQAGDGAGTTSDSSWATVGGGTGNFAEGEFATVGAGQQNTASGDWATVSGGSQNTAVDDYSSVGGGAMNRAEGAYSTIAGGGPSNPPILATSNRVTDDYGTVSGGGHNQAGNDEGTTDDARYATVGGGQANTARNAYSTVGGGSLNSASGICATVGGGEENTASRSHATVGGGETNFATSDSATVGGGYSNEASGTYATVGGGYVNTASGEYATVAGGARNRAEGAYSTIAGGGPSDPETYTTNNRVTDSYGTVGGGGNNQAGDNVGTADDATYATVGGGNGNTAGAFASTVPGGYGNEALAPYSFAAGRGARATHRGSFVWADSQDLNVESSAEDRVLFCCKGGVHFTNKTGAGVSWTPGDTSWQFGSDRNLKEDFVEINPKEVLDKISLVSITEWNFKGYSQRHVGPMAQDFHALFPLGGSDTMIDSGDLQGVSLAAIQGLHEIVKQKDAKISSLEARIEALEALVEKLVQSQAGGE